jgi:hypothetical protein
MKIKALVLSGGCIQNNFVKYKKEDYYFIKLFYSDITLMETWNENIAACINVSTYEYEKKMIEDFNGVIFRSHYKNNIYYRTIGFLTRDDARKAAKWIEPKAIANEMATRLKGGR